MLMLHLTYVITIYLITILIKQSMEEVFDEFIFTHMFKETTYYYDIRMGVDNSLN